MLFIDDHEKRSLDDLVYLEPDTYDCIYIRRGDKLIAESLYLKTDRYIEVLLEKNPDCKRIFLLTDDYNSYIDLNEYIHRNNLDINVITTCDPNTKGIVVYDTKLDVQFDNCIIQNSREHTQYFEKVRKDLQESTPLDKMSPDEIKEHMNDLLVGVDIALHSKNCILDKFSNVARFISVAHKDYKKVHDIRYLNENISMNWTQCPSYW